MPLVLFVCTANICRSPMAAALFKQQLAARAAELPPGDWTVLSAGTWAIEGQPAARGSREALAERGLDLSAHRSAPVDEGLLRAADLVLVMTESHRDGLLAEFPAAQGKVRLLSEARGLVYDVADPYGKGREEYEQCARELAGLIEAGFDRIVAWAAGDNGGDAAPA